MRWFVPEVLQTSAMDCGPAVLKAAMDGFGRPLHLGYLREACQTDVDGTSINTLGELARTLGLDATQSVLPLAHLGLQPALPLPAIVVTQNPDGGRHFILLWRRVGPWIQVMDPAKGRCWIRQHQLRDQLYQHAMTLPEAQAMRWIRSPFVMAGLGQRLLDLGLSEADAEPLLGRACDDPDQAGRLELALSTVEDLRACGAAGSANTTALLQSAMASPLERPSIHRTVEGVSLTGAVVLTLTPGDKAVAPPASAALREALSASQPHPLATLLRVVHELAPWFGPTALAVATLAAVSGLVQAALLRALLDMGLWLQTPGSRFAALAVLAGLTAVTGGLLWGWSSLLARLSRGLELKLRTRFHAKLPRLGDRYFATRLASDLAERAHAMAALRSLPAALSGIVQAGAGLLTTCAGLLWLDSGLWLPVFTAASAAVAAPWAVHKLLANRELRRQTYDGALSRTYLDAMLGAEAVRAHSAELTLLRDHESLLVGWQRAAQDALHLSVAATWAQSVLGVLLAGWMVSDHLARAPHAGAVLLVVVWATGLPRQGEALAKAMRQLPALQSIAARLLEALDASEEDPDAEPMPAQWQHPLALEARDLEVRAAGRPVLCIEHLQIEAGAHVAIVGRSGAGKSTLLSVLLGWRAPTSGTLRLNGIGLHTGLLGAPRQRLAWVDPALQLWNDSLQANLEYGNETRPLHMDHWLQQAELLEVLAGLPEGLSSKLGEGGALLSGGQGQRVRLGRALAHQDAGLVLLDEAFRGLDRGQRQRLMQRARDHWSASTLLAVTHDASDVLGFDRVLVVEAGRIVEDGTPETLLARDGAFADLVHRDREVRRTLTQRDGWRQLRLEQGRMEEVA